MCVAVYKKTGRLDRLGSDSVNGIRVEIFSRELHNQLNTLFCDICTLILPWTKYFAAYTYESGTLSASDAVVVAHSP